VDTHEQLRPDHASPQLAPSALTLLESARQMLAAGEHDTSAASRYLAAHLAALRAAAAVVAAKQEPGIPRRRKRPRNIWELLPGAEPAFSEWAARFAIAGAHGPVGLCRIRVVSRRQADKLLRDAKAFVSLAEDTLGVTGQPQRSGIQHYPAVARPGPGSSQSWAVEPR
jgi:hypothetical protein